jgi:hypothetical protein
MMTFRLRSKAWFDKPLNSDMTVLYLERFLDFGPFSGRVAVRSPSHRHRADRV